jgi:hypothetical protein
MIQIQKHASPPVVDGPLEHLSACHRRIEHRLDVLQRASDLLAERAEEALQAISNSLRFMDTSGLLHTVDEEESLFPRLRQAMSVSEMEYLEGLSRSIERPSPFMNRSKKLWLDCSSIVRKPAFSGIGTSYRGLALFTARTSLRRTTRLLRWRSAFCPATNYR